jgi:hypothetical protein
MPGEAAGGDGDGGRREMPTLGIPLKIWCIVMTVILLCNLGHLLTDDHDRNMMTIRDALDAADLGEVRISVDHIRGIYAQLGGIIDILERRGGTVPMRHAYYDRLGDRVNRFLTLNGDIQNLDDLTLRFRDIMTFISDNRDTFTVPNTRLVTRLVELFELYNRHRPAPIRVNQTIAAPVNVLVNGLGYMDIAEIPYTVPPSAGAPFPSIDPVVTRPIRSFPGYIFIAAFSDY